MVTAVPNEKFMTGMTDFQGEVMRDFDNNVCRFFMLNWHRRARKSSLAINLLIKECVAHPMTRYGYITSTYVAAKNIIWRDPNMIKSYLPMDQVKKINETELYVEFKNGSILSLHGADKPDSIAGVDFEGVVIDEWQLTKEDVWTKILRPIMAQHEKRWAMFIFTPKGKNHVHKMWCASKDREGWKRYELKASDSGIFTQKALDDMKIEVPESTYLQEMECEFNDDASTVFKGIDVCTFGKYADYVNGTIIEIEKYNPMYSYVTSADLAKTVDFTVIITMCRETKKVVSFQRFNQIDWSLQKEKIIAETIKYNSTLVIDATGVGDPIVEDLKKAGVKIPVNGIIKFNNSNKKEMITRLIVSIEQRLITFPNINVLVDELGIFGIEVTNAGNIRYTAPEGQHDDCVISLAMAVHGVKNFLYTNHSNQEVPKQNLITDGAY